MSYRTVFPGLVAATLFLLAPPSAFAEEPAFPPGAETAGNSLPSEIMLRASRLMQVGRGDVLVLCRTTSLALTPERQPSSGPDRRTRSVLVAVRNARAVNGWAFGDIPKLQRTIDAVLLWDARYPDSTLDPAAHERMRAGLTGLRDRSVEKRT